MRFPVRARQPANRSPIIELIAWWAGAVICGKPRRAQVEAGCCSGTPYAVKRLFGNRLLSAPKVNLHAAAAIVVERLDAAHFLFQPQNIRPPPQDTERLLFGDVQPALRVRHEVIDAVRDESSAISFFGFEVTFDDDEGDEILPSNVLTKEDPRQDGYLNDCCIADYIRFKR